MKLVIVESPTKARTLSRFLPEEYKTIASMGHLRDLPKSELGVDTEHDFKPSYAIVSGKQKIINELKKTASKAQTIILATDPDREGEAIAWHVVYLLKGEKPQSVSRITFHEITKSAIEQALQNPGKINLKLVNSQQARRILDRLVGYKLSPLLWSKVRRGLSAGRVQSVALRFIVQREREIEKFVKEEYWIIETKVKSPHFAKASRGKQEEFLASLHSKNGQKYEETKTLQLFAGPYKYQKSSITNQKEAEEVSQDLKKQVFMVESVEEKETKRQPPPPFITSTLQQAANHAFGFSTKKTMMLAQKLYEEGNITYHRTDSFNLAQQAINQFRDYIKKEFGQNYLEPTPRVFQTRSKVAQEAHEAIRPTDIRLATGPAEPTGSCQALSPTATHKGVPGRGGPPAPTTPSSDKFTRDEQRLYDLIWRRALATQMAAARLGQTNVAIKAGDYLLKANGVRTLFDGFLRLYPQRLKENLLPKLTKSEKLSLVQVLPKQNFTTPPPRYTEASLVKTLESKGIGRPSTYAPIISLIQIRAYVEKKEGVFWPTPVGEAVTDFLVAHFETIVEIPFTVQMEEDLDAIARGEKERVPVLKDFYGPFEKKVTSVSKNSSRVKIKVQPTGQKCPKCQKGEQVIRVGRFGKFLSCSKFPECDWKAAYIEKVEGIKCPECSADIVIKKTRRGKQFYGCANYPKCKWASWRKPR